MYRISLMVLLLLLMISKSKAQGYVGIQDDPDDLNVQDILDARGEKIGEYNVYLGCGNGELTKPIIVVEGIDPTNSIFCRDIYASIAGANDLFVAEELQAAGFDIVVLNFQNGAADLVVNSGALISLLLTINSQVQEPIVVMGLSMGGVIARYALGQMEMANVTHNCRLFISFDSPQNGANIPLGLQNMADFWVNSLVPVLNTPFTSLLNSALLLQAPAMKQLAFPYFTTNTAHTTFYNNMNAMNGNTGMPLQCRNVAIACGSGNGTQQATQPGMQLLNWNNTIGVASILNNVWAMPGNNVSAVFEGLYIGPQVQSLWPPILGLGANVRMNFENNKPDLDHVPGSHFNGYSTFTDLFTEGSQILGFNPPNYFFNNPTNDDWEVPFIPTTSALGLVTPSTYIFDFQNAPNGSFTSRFDRLYFGEVNNLEHLQMTPGIRNFILEEVLIGRFFQNRSEKGARVYRSPNFIVAGRNVTNLSAQGDYIVTNAANISHVASTSLRIESGFRVLAGARYLGTVNPFECGGQFNNPNTINGTINRLGLQENQITLLGNLEPEELDFISYSKETSMVRPLMLAPNPNSGSFKIFNYQEPQEYTIYSLEGKIINTGNLQTGENKFDIEFEPGMYFLRTLKGESIKIIIK